MTKSYVNTPVVLTVLCLAVFSVVGTAAEAKDDAAISLSGPDPHATIYLKDGNTIEGDVVASDENTITVCPSSGRQITISRSHIKEIKLDQQVEGNDKRLPLVSDAHEYVWGDGKTFRNPEVLLVLGKLLTADKLIVTGPDIILYTNASAFYPDKSDQDKSMTIALSDVEEVRVPAKNHLILGTAIGAFVGLFTMLETNKRYEASHVTVTMYYSYVGGRLAGVDKEYSYEALPNSYKIAIVAGGTALGALLGHSFKKWETIYPFEEPSNVENTQSLLNTSSNELARWPKSSKGVPNLLIGLGVFALNMPL